jgi:hypothetical protein
MGWSILKATPTLQCVKKMNTTSAMYASTER